MYSGDVEVLSDTAVQAGYRIAASSIISMTICDRSGSSWR